MIWAYSLAQPIKREGARSLLTLADARGMVLAVPDFRKKPHWEVASRSLLIAAGTGEDQDLARATTDMLAAIEAEGEPAAKTPPRKKRRGDASSRTALWIEKAKAVRGDA